MRLLPSCCRSVAALLVVLLAGTTVPAAAFGAFNEMHDSSRKIESLRIYVAPGGPEHSPNYTFNISKAKERCDASMLGPHSKPLKLSKGSSLEPVKDWLHVNNEYIALEYMLHFLNCHPNLTPNPKEADICFPTCRNWKYHPPDSSWRKQYVHFEVRNGAMFDGCSKYISFNPELIGKAAFDPAKDPREVKCSIGVPYFHGVYAPAEEWDMAPWDLSLDRDTLLSFFGGVWRKKVRWEFHSAAGNVARQLAANESAVAGLRNQTDQPYYRIYYNTPLESEAVKKIFPEMVVSSQKRSAHIKAMQYMWTSDAMYELAWLTYATSQFCWNPHGDTPTRRAFYDAWMFGCIPVIPSSAVVHYSRIFGGHFYDYHKITLADIVVVVPDNATAREV